MMPASAAGRTRSSFAGAALVLALVLAYAGGLRAPFVFDDAGAVVNNTTIRELWSPAVLQPPRDGSTTTGRPLVNLTFALNYAISGVDEWSYHALNVALHAGAALALFGIVRRVTLRMRAGQLADNSTVARSATRHAFLVALVWGLHPLQSESVICVAQRTEVLCGFLYLLSLYAFLRGAHAAAPARWLGVSVAFCALGMAAKEVMVTAPLAVLLVDRTFVAGSFGAAWRARRGYYAALAMTWLPLVWLVAGGGGARGVSAGFDLGVSPWRYLLTQCEALTVYLRLAFWPDPLVLDYGTAIVRSATDVVPEGLLVLSLLAGTFWALHRRPIIGFFGAWFFLVLAPSSSVVPLITQTIAEHRMYLPLAGLVAAGAFMAVRAGRRAEFVVLAASLALGVQTASRVRVYRDPVTLWRDTVANRPDNPRAHHNLALALREKGKTDLADAHFARAVELDAGYVAARHNWAMALLEQGRVSDAIAQFEAAIALARAAPTLAADPVARENLAEAHRQLARLCERANDVAAAEKHYAAALELGPRDIATHIRLGVLLARNGRLEAAAMHLRTAADLDPTNADALANLGNVLLLQGRPREAIATYEAVLRLRPDDPRTRENIRVAREALR